MAANCNKGTMLRLASPGSYCCAARLSARITHGMYCTRQNIAASYGTEGLEIGRSTEHKPKLLVDG